MSRVIVGVDIGGTKVLAGAVTNAGTIISAARRTTPGRRVLAAHVEDALVEAVLEAADGSPLECVGVAAAGFVDAAGERVMFAPHLPWRGEPLREVLADRLGCPVALDNDANCAALAEAQFGAARGARSALLITLGTGIGGALLYDGRVLRGWNGMAGEFGHMQVVPDGRACECGRAGCWEQYSSGNALVRNARALMGRQPSILNVMASGAAERVTGPMVTAAAEEGDLAARNAFAAIGDWLGVGISSLVAALDPELIVVGGGVAVAGDRLLKPARAALQRSLVGAEHRALPALVAAQLGPEAGMIGAAVLARRLLRDQARDGPEVIGQFD